MKSNVESLKEELSQLRSEKAEKEKELDAIEIDIDSQEFEEMYEQMLDDCYEEIKIGSLTFSPSQILKECDPIAYRCGKIDYADSMDVAETEEYKQVESELYEIEDRIEEIESEIEELESEEKE